MKWAFWFLLMGLSHNSYICENSSHFAVIHSVICGWVWVIFLSSQHYWICRRQCKYAVRFPIWKLSHHVSMETIIFKCTLQGLQSVFHFHICFLKLVLFMCLLIKEVEHFNQICTETVRCPCLFTSVF